MCNLHQVCYIPLFLWNHAEFKECCHIIKSQVACDTPIIINRLNRIKLRKLSSPESYRRMLHLYQRKYQKLQKEEVYSRSEVSENVQCRSNKTAELKFSFPHNIWQKPFQLLKSILKPWTGKTKTYKKLTL